MEQSLVPLNGSTGINSVSMTTSISTNDSILDQQHNEDIISPVAVVVVPSDDVMDLLRAIEMSRLQSVRENEQNIYRPNTHSSNNNSNDKNNYFNDLQQTIELSLKTKNDQQSTNELTSSFFNSFFQV
jgi:hypothetical protein